MSYITDQWDLGEVHVKDNIVGWYFPETDEHRPFNDEQVQELFEYGVITSEMVKATAKAYNEHLSATLLMHSIQEERFWNDPEFEDARNNVLFEMRAAFGEGAEVVNVVTGRRMKV